MVRAWSSTIAPPSMPAWPATRARCRPQLRASRLAATTVIVEPDDEMEADGLVTVHYEVVGRRATVRLDRRTS
jgi:hypothetical protein